MIKIERSTAINATIVRNDRHQPVTLNMIITVEELASLTADSGSILYSVDEMEVKTVEFQPAPAPVVEPIADTDTVVISTVVKPVIQPARKTALAKQA